MKNVNRDYLVIVDAKTAAIKPPKDMKFFITDILTCNIFFQLEISDTNSSFTGAPNEDASNYTLTLRVLKPDNTTKEKVANFMYQSGNHFYYIADLDPEFTNIIGYCECELFIETEVTKEDGSKQHEINTTDSFEYEVVKSIFTEVGEIIEGDPDYPGILDSFATKDYVSNYINNQIENMDLYGYATRDYVSQVIVGGEFDLSEYVTDEELRNALANVDLDNYVTEAELAQALVDVTTGGTVDLSAYVTDKELEDALAEFGSNVELSDYVTKDELIMKNYITDTELTDKNYATVSQIPTTLPANGGNADTVSGYSIWVGSEAEYYNELSSITPNKIYFIEEDD